MAKEYTLIGGNGTVVSPLEVTEDGDYFAGDSRAFNPVKVRASGSGSSTLSGLTDVDISNPSDGQTLVYNAAVQKWENGAGGGGFTLLHGTYDGNTNTIALNKSCEELFVLTQASVVGIQFEPVDGMTVIEFVAQATNEYNFAMLSGLVAYGSGSDVVVFRQRP